MSVPSEIDAEWNAWYNGEYIPGYRKAPEVIYARRYRVYEGASKYTTVYEFASTAAPESAEWKHQKSAFLTAFPTHAAGDDACPRIARRIYSDGSLANQGPVRKQPLALSRRPSRQRTTKHL